MKSREDFQTLEKYQKYLVAYYAGQILTRSGDEILSVYNRAVRMAEKVINNIAKP